MDNFTKIPRLLNEENSDKLFAYFLLRTKNISDMVSHKSLEARPLFFNKF